MDLQSSRETYDKVWKFQLNLDRFEPAGFSRPQTVRTKGQEVTTHRMFDWEVELIEWMKIHIKKQVFINPVNVIYFEEPKEAMLFKLTWS